MKFSRTLPGIIAECRFHQKTTVHVEGHTDIPFYEKLLQGYGCRIVPRDGRNQCEALADALAKHNYPYVVILDGDYGILVSTQSNHSRVILLNRYSFENYLFEEEPIKQFCRYRNSKTDLAELECQFHALVNNIELKFKELIVLDVAHQRSRTGCKALPDKPERFFTARRSVDFRDDYILERRTQAIQHIDKNSVNEARTLVEDFLKRHRLVDLLPGHFAFAIICRLIAVSVNRTIQCDDIRVPLSTSVWDLAESADHNQLKEHIHHAVKEAQKMPKLGKEVQA